MTTIQDTVRARKTIRDLPDEGVRDRQLLVRVDFNVPVDAEGRVTDSSRVDATVPTLAELLDRGGRLVLVSHRGRPREGPDRAYSMEPVAEVLQDRLGADVAFHSWLPGVDLTPIGGQAGEVTAPLPEAPVVLLENVRFHPSETANDPQLARHLGDLGTHFVSDAFGTAHRAHASTVGAAEVVRERGGDAVAGLLMARELHYLGSVLSSPERPFVGLLGGAKISGKLEVIESVLERVDTLLLGGAMANTFFRAMGLEVGDSLVEEELAEAARGIMENAGDRLVLPVDCVVSDRIGDDAETRVVERDSIGPGDRVGDVGPATRQLFRQALLEARTVVWNGPMGVFEAEPFAQGTLEVAKAVAEVTARGGTTVVGGGDSVAAARRADVAERLSHVSTGGGASLDYLARKPLPGVEVLSLAD